MMVTLPIRSLMTALVASAGLWSAPVLAVEAHTEQGAEIAAPNGVAQFTVGDTVLRAQMPCVEPADGPPGPEGIQTSVCILGYRMFVFAASAGVAPSDSGLMASDFGLAYEEVRSSSDTDFIEEVEVDGRRVLRATRNPASGYGVMQAVEIAPDAVVYVISMSRLNPDQPLSEADKQEMRDFVASLEIIP